jgi:hypothetical protein
MWIVSEHDLEENVRGHEKDGDTGVGKNCMMKYFIIRIG